MPNPWRTAALAFALTLTATTAPAIEDQHQRLIAAEPDRIATANGKVARDQGGLTLRLANGKAVTRRDEHECGQNGAPFNTAHCARYVFVDQLADARAFLVLVLAYEDYAYEWIDEATGKATLIPDRPHFSPSGDRFAVVRACEMGFNGIQLWSRNAGGIALEWERELPDFYSFNGWTTNREIALSISRFTGNELVEGLPATLIKTERWELREPPAR